MTTEEKLPPDIEKLKTEKNIAGLIEALTYRQDYRIRHRAADAMGELQDPTFIAPLLAALKHEGRVSVVITVVNALRNFKALPEEIKKDIFETFRERLNNEKNAQVHIKIVKVSLSLFDYNTSLSLLLIGLQDPSLAKQVTDECITALDKDLSMKMLGDILDNADEDTFNRVLQALSSLLVSSSQSSRHAAIRTLEQIGSLGVESLITELNTLATKFSASPPSNVVKYNVENRKRNVPHLYGNAALVKGRAIAEALARIGDIRAVEPILYNFLPDERFYDSETLHNTLISFGPDAVEPLNRALQDKSFNDSAQHVIANALKTLTVKSNLDVGDEALENYGIEPQVSPSETRKKLEAQLDQLVQTYESYFDTSCVCSS